MRHQSRRHSLNAPTRLYYSHRFASRPGTRYRPDRISFSKNHRWSIFAAMKKGFIILLVAISVLLANVCPLCASEFAFGADLSYLKQAEDGGAVFKDGTNAMSCLQIFHNHGYNWIRLRIFVEPVSNNLPNNLAYTIAE